MSEKQQSKVTGGDKFGSLLRQVVPDNNAEVVDLSSKNEILFFTDSQDKDKQADIIFDKEKEADDQKLDTYLEESLQEKLLELAQELQHNKGKKVDLVSPGSRTKMKAWYQDGQFACELRIRGKNSRLPIVYKNSQEAFIDFLQKNGFVYTGNNAEKKEDGIQPDTATPIDDPVSKTLPVPVVASAGHIEGTLHPLSTEDDTDSPPKPDIDDSIFDDNSGLPAMPLESDKGTVKTALQDSTVASPIVFTDNIAVNERSNASVSVDYADAKADSGETVMTDDIELPKAVVENEPSPFFAEDLDAHINELQKNPQYKNLGEEIQWRNMKEVKGEVQENTIEVAKHGLNEELFDKDMTPEEREMFEGKYKHIEELRLAMASARQDYIRVRDNKTAAIDKLKRFFGGSLKNAADDEIETIKRRYDNAVTEYTDARLDVVREQSITPEDLKRNLVGVLEEVRLFEGIYKYNESTENAEDGLSDRMKNWSVARLDAYRNWYKNLSTGQKLAFSGAVMGVGIVTGATFGAATAAFGMSVGRVFSALSTGRGLQMLGNELAQKSFEKGNEGAIAEAQAEMTSIEKGEGSAKISAVEQAEAMVAAMREKCQIDIAKSTERIDRLELNRDRSKWAGIVTGTMLAFGVPQWAIGNFFHLEGVQASVETVAHKAKEIGGNLIEDVHLVAGDIESKVHEVGSAVQKARELLHTYAVGSGDVKLPGAEAPTLVHGVSAMNAADIHSKLTFPKTIITLDQIAREPLDYADVIPEQIPHTVAPESAKPLFDSAVTAPLPKGGTIIGSLRDMKVPGMHPAEIAKEWFASKANADNPFFVPDKMTMPGAQAVVEGGKIVDVVDKQGALLGVIRRFSGESPAVWGKLKDVPVADILKDRSEINRRAQELIGRYADYLGKDMPKIQPGQTMKQLVSLTAKAYYKKKGWA